MEDSSEEEEERGGGVQAIHTLSIETAGTEEEAAEGLAAALEMQVEYYRGNEGEEGGDGYQRSLEVL